MLRPWGKLFGFRALHSAGTLAGPAKVNQNQVNSAALRCAFFGKNAQLFAFNVCNHCILVYIHM